LPYDRRISKWDFWDELGDFMDIINAKMGYRTIDDWSALDRAIGQNNRDRELTIFVLAEDSVQLQTTPNFINVHELGVDATPPLDKQGRPIYILRDVTGIDFNVQAVLASQELAVNALISACEMIEGGDLRHFTFVCSHATHRSAGCAVLLASFVYHKASIVFSTRRTENSAASKGLVALS